MIDALDAKGILAARFRAHDMERVDHAIEHGAVPVQRVETHFIAGRCDGIRAMIESLRLTRLTHPTTGRTSPRCSHHVRMRRVDAGHRADR